MINDTCSYYNNNIEKRTQSGYIQPVKHQFSLISTFGAIASGIGVFDYLDTYKTKNIKHTVLNKKKEKSSGIIRNLLEDFLETKRKTPAKYYGLLALGTMLISSFIYAGKPSYIWVKDDENKEKNLKKSLMLSNIIGAISSGIFYAYISNVELNHIDKFVKKKDYKTKNALKSIAIGALVATVVGGLTLIANKLTLDKFKKEQKQENNG